MPLVGQKKLYLIDEAHMLSKAAFNAFLKILEEPPMTVLFILATTEVPKIPTTVLSRCFQLIFNPIESISLKRHLYNICSHEEVTIDEAALDIILDETEGSARDAINLLERVRFSNDTITEQTVLAVLGKISIKDLFTLFEHIIDQQATNLLQHLSTIQFEQRSPQFLWDMIVQLGRALLWVKYGLQNVPGPMGKHIQELQQLAQKCSLNRLNAILNFLWSHEELFLRTNKKHLFLEMVLLQLCQQVDVADLEDLIKAVHQSKDHGQQTPPVTAPTKLSQAMPHQEHTNQTPSIIQQPQQTEAAPLPQQTTEQAPQQPAAQPVTANPEWTQFLQKLTQVNDPLLCSILNQSTFVSQDMTNKTITIQLSAESAFFKNKIEETKNLWLPILSNCFTDCHGITYAPRPQNIVLQQPTLNQSKPAPIAAQTTKPVLPSRPVAKESEWLMIKNAAQWPRASLILRYFPGKIKKESISRTP